jgi:hypothetical protein
MHKVLEKNIGMHRPDWILTSVGIQTEKYKAAKGFFTNVSQKTQHGQRANKVSRPLFQETSSLSS